MIGVNRLVLNQATMNEAVREYVQRIMPTIKVEVKAILVKENGYEVTVDGAGPKPDSPTPFPFTSETTFAGGR